MWYFKVEYYDSRRVVEDLKNIIYVLIGLHDTRKKFVKIWVNLHFIDLNEEMWKMLRYVNTYVKGSKFLFFKGFFFRWKSWNFEMIRDKPCSLFSKRGNSALTTLLK